MTSLLRRIRAVLFVGGVYAATWAGLGAIMALLRIMRNERPWLSAWSFVGHSLVEWTALGTIAGVIFAALLMVLEHGKLLRALSLGRVAAFGAVGGTTGFGVVWALANLSSRVSLRPSVLAGYVIACSAFGVFSACLSVLFARENEKRSSEREGRADPAHLKEADESILRRIPTRKPAQA